MKKIGLLCALLLLGTFGLKAQHADSVITLNEVEAKGVRFGDFTAGSKVFTIDSISLNSYKQGSVADILAMHSLVSVNSYGPEGLASISLRGGSTRHTAIIWNGLNLRSHSSGGFNFSAFPAGFIDALTIQSGGSSTIYGSGTSNGAVIISNNLSCGQSKFSGELNIETGSFGTTGINGSVSKTGPRFATRFKAGYQDSENNFKFKNTQKFGDPIERLEHAAFNRISLGQQNVIKTGKYSRIETDFIYTSLNKLIPSLMSDLEAGSAEQTDKSYRGAINYSVYHTKWFFKLRTGILSDAIWYFDSLIMSNPSLNKSFAVLNEAESKIILSNRHNISIGADESNEFAKISNYIADTFRIRFSVYGRYSINFLKSRLYLSAEIRKEYVNSGKVPFVYSVSGAYKLSSDFSLKTIFSKHYSLPVFDDLFWSEDAYSKGNPDLKPEYGHNIESGLHFNHMFDNAGIENEITFYRNKLTNLIIWLSGNDGKYAPSNMQNSLNRGIEFSGSAFYTFHDKALVMNYLYGYSNALIFDNLSDQEGSQRFYVPRHKAVVSLGFKWSDLNITYSQTINSKRYIDKIYILDAYTLTDLRVAYLIDVKKCRLSVNLGIKNLFNTSYQVMSGFAQPLRNYSIGLNLSF